MAGMRCGKMVLQIYVHTFDVATFVPVNYFFFFSGWAA
jgi:hypothetical protein